MALNSYEKIRELLKGSRFGRASSSELSVLGSKTQSLEGKISKASDLKDILALEREYRALQEFANALREGGACDHGADQGPNCTHCKGHLKGKYVSYPPGLDVIDYAIRTHVKDENKRTKLQFESDRASTALQESVNLLKRVGKALETKRREVERKSKKRDVSKQSSTTSVEAVKRQFIDTEALNNSHDVIRNELSMQKIPIRIRVDSLAKIQLMVSVADLNADYSSSGFATVFDWFKGEVCSQVKTRFGRSIDFSSLKLTGNDEDVVVSDSESLGSLLEEKVDLVRTNALSLVNLQTLAHESFVECYYRCSDYWRSNRDPLLTTKLKTFSHAISCIKLIHWPQRLSRALFQSMAYRSCLQELDLSFSEFHLNELFEVGFALDGVVSLKISRRCQTSVDKSSFKAFELAAKDRRCFRNLQKLDLSGLSLIAMFEPFAPLGQWFCKFIDNHPSLTVLNMNRCFYIERGGQLSDFTCDFIAEFHVQLAKCLPHQLDHLEFNGNAFVSTSSAESFLFWALKCVSSVEMCECRLWSCVEEEDASTGSLGSSFQPLNSNIEASQLKRLNFSDTSIGLEAVLNSLLPFVQRSCPQIEELRLLNVGLNENAKEEVISKLKSILHDSKLNNSIIM